MHFNRSLAVNEIHSVHSGPMSIYKAVGKFYFHPKMTLRKRCSDKDGKSSQITSAVLNVNHFKCSEV